MSDVPKKTKFEIDKYKEKISEADTKTKDVLLNQKVCKTDIRT